MTRKKSGTEFMKDFPQFKIRIMNCWRRIKACEWKNYSNQIINSFYFVLKSWRTVSKFSPKHINLIIIKTLIFCIHSPANSPKISYIFRSWNYSQACMCVRRQLDEITRNYAKHLNFGGVWNGDDRRLRNNRKVWSHHNNRISSAPSSEINKNI